MQELAEQWGLQFMPTFMLFKKGQKVCLYHLYHYYCTLLASVLVGKNQCVECVALFGSASHHAVRY